jgi:hypothetical protein
MDCSRGVGPGLRSSRDRIGQRCGDLGYLSGWYSEGYVRGAAMKVHFISPKLWPAALGAYAAGGVLMGVGALAPLVALGVPQGFAMFLIVAVMLPVWMVAVSGWFPCPRIIWIGAALLVAGFVVGVRLYENPKVWAWSPRVLLAVKEPEFLFAIVGCGSLGTFVWWVVGAVRKVGLPDALERCDHCGYLLTGITPERCPECGG